MPGLRGKEVQQGLLGHGDNAIGMVLSLPATDLVSWKTNGPPGSGVAVGS